MKLSQIIESEDLVDPFSIIAQDFGSEVAVRLRDWYGSKPYHAEVTDSLGTIMQGLLDGARLVGNPWKEQVDKDLGELYVVDHGKQLMIGLQKNANIVDLVSTAAASVAGHALRGIAFGYDADAVNKYVVPKKDTQQWSELLDKLGVTRSDSYSSGYASTCSRGTCSLTVDPGDVPDRSVFDQLGELVGSSVWCPIDYEYNRIEGMSHDAHVSDHICNHEMVHEPDKDPNHRHWYSFNFIPPWKQ